MQGDDDKARHPPDSSGSCVQFLVARRRFPVHLMTPLTGRHPWARRRLILGWRRRALSMVIGPRLTLPTEAFASKLLQGLDVPLPGSYLNDAAPCTVDILLYAAAARLHAECDTTLIHPNHFMHGTMVLNELEKRLAQAHTTHGGGSKAREWGEGIVGVLRGAHQERGSESLAALQQHCDENSTRLI